MSQVIPTTEPVRVFSGDTIKWKRSFSDYSSASYDLHYRLIGEVNQLLTAAADGTGFLVTVSNTASFAWLPGTYRLIGYVEKSDDSERYNVYEGDLEVLLDPATVADGHETRSFWRQVRDNLREIIKGKAKQADSSYTIAGRSVSKMSWQEVLEAYNMAAEMVKQEDAEDKARRGEFTSNLVGIRFGSANGWNSKRYPYGES